MPCCRFGSQSRPRFQPMRNEFRVTGLPVKGSRRRWGGPADLQTSGSRRSVLGGNPSFALRSLCAVIPDPLEGTPRRLDGTADRGGRSRTDDKPSRTEATDLGATLRSNIRESLPLENWEGTPLEALLRAAGIILGTPAVIALALVTWTRRKKRLARSE